MRIVTSLIVGGVIGNNSTVAAELPPGDREPVSYRRILVPADTPAAWPGTRRGGSAAEKYLPIESSEFDAWIAAANQPGATARIASAEYSARLEGQRLVDGRAAWTVERRGGGPAFLPLANTSLIVRSAEWSGEPTEPARLGWWPRPGGASYGLEVPQSGVLETTWHTPPGATRASTLEIPLRLPAAEMTRLTLDLPAGKQPVMEGSVVLKSSLHDSSQPGTTDGNATGPTESDPAPGAIGSSRVPAVKWRRWVLAVGQFTSGNLRIEETGTTQMTVPPAVAIHDDLRYRITDQGLDVEATLRLDRSDSLLRELSVLVPSSLQLVTVTAAGQNLRWRTVSDSRAAGITTDRRDPRAPAAAGRQAVRAMIELPAAAGGELTLTLKAWGTPVIDRAWKLPKLRVEGASWTSGTWEIAVGDSLELRDVQPLDCVQTGVRQGETPIGRRETLAFQSFSPDAGVELVVGHRQAAGRVRSTATLEVGNLDVQGRLVTRLKVDQGSLLSVSAELEPGWLIDAVETIPADALGEWYVEARDAAARHPDRGSRNLQLQLHRAASPALSVTIIVTARLQRTGSFDPLELRTLAMLRWPGLEVERKLLRLKVVEPYELEPVGEMPLVAVGDLTEDDTRRVEAPAEGRWFDLTTAATNAAVRLVPTRGTYDAEIQLDAVAGGGWLETTYDVTCRPRRGGVEELLVYFSEPLGESPRWVNSDTLEPLVAQRMPRSDPRLGGVPPGGELWLLPLGRTYVGEVSLTATTRSPLATRRSIPLVSLPDASGQQGRVAVRSADLPPSIAVEGLTPAPLPAGSESWETSADAPAQAVYRYQPIHFYDVGAPPKLWLSPPDVTKGEDTLLARRIDVESFYAATGRGVHRATYQLEITAHTEVGLQLPAAAQLTSASLDGQALLPTTKDGIPGTMFLSLPWLRTTAVLTLNFETDEAPLANGCHLRTPLPASEMTTLCGAWTVWLPAGFTVARGEEQLLWRQRIFGPLARPADERPFNPLRADDWLALWPGLGQGDASAEPMFRTRPATADRSVQLAAHSTAIDGPSPSAEPPRVPTSGSANEQFAPRGWHAFQVGFVGARPGSISLVHAPTSAAWSWSIFLGCLCGLPLCKPRAAYFVTLVAAAMVLGVLLPVAYAPLAAGAVLGLLLSPICAWIIRQSTQSARPDSQDQQPSGGSRTVGQTPLVLLLAATSMFALASVSCAQTAATGKTSGLDAHPAATSAPTPEGTTVHRVLVPVDEAGTRVGTKYFVNEQFARRLLRMSDQRNRERGSWLLVGMSATADDGDLSSRRPASLLGSRQPAATFGSWTMTLEIEVLTRDAVVELPLVEQEAEWPTAASLDGIPTSIVWNDSGVGCRILVREPGRYQLSLRFEPQASVVAGRRQVRLSLPPLAGSTLRLTSSEPLSDPVVGGSRLDQRVDATGAVWTGELDGSGRLALDWTDQLAGSGPSATPKLDELRWLRVAPDGTFLDVKYVLRHRGVTVVGGTQWPDTMVLRVDRRCELLSDVGHGAASVVEQLPDGRQSITTRTEPEASGQQHDVLLSFRVRDAAPLGRLRIPTIELTSLPVEKGWLAVSADPSLDCVPIGDVAIAAETAADFVAAWGASNGDATPQLVLASDNKAEQAWSLAVRPRQAASDRVERLLVAVGRERFRLLYQADVEPQGADRFGWSLAVPADLSVDRVTAEQAGAPLSLRWVRRSANRVNVYFASKATDAYHLKLTGEVAVPGCGEHRLPRVVAVDSPRASQSLSLYREKDVLATVRAPATAVLPETAPIELPPAEWNARFVGAYTMDPTAAGTRHEPIAPRAAAAAGRGSAVRVLTEPNRVLLDGRTLTTLFTDGGLWFATFACQLRVEQGELDTLELRVPSTWVGPFDFQPAAAAVSLSSTDAQSSTLMVHFANPVQTGNVVEFEIRSPLTVARRGGPVSVPRIAPLTEGRWESFLSVPASIDANPAPGSIGSYRVPAITWNRAGVESAEPPADLPSNLAPPGDSQTYRVVAEPFSVALRSQPTITSLSVVRLAEMTALVGPNGGQYMVTQFFISPLGLSECVLEMPDDQRLVRLTLDGHPAIMRPLEGHRYWVQLGPPSLPQTLRVVTRAPKSNDEHDRHIHLRRPSLFEHDQPVPVELSLWSLCRPATSATERVTGAAPLTAGDQSVLRLDRLVSISESATRAVIESPVADGYNWFVTWSERLRAAEHAAQTQHAKSVRSGQVSHEIAPADDPLTLAIARSEAWRRQAEELFAMLAPATGAANDAAARERPTALDVVAPPGCGWSYFVAAATRHPEQLVRAGGPRRGGSRREELRVELVPADLTPFQTRVVVLSCVIVLATAVGWLAGQPSTRDWFVRRPYAAAALVGFAAWAWLQPSWLGLLIAVASVFLWLREMLRARAAHVPGSSATTVTSCD